MGALGRSPTARSCPCDASLPWQRRVGVARDEERSTRLHSSLKIYLNPSINTNTKKEGTQPRCERPPHERGSSFAKTRAPPLAPHCSSLHRIARAPPYHPCTNVRVATPARSCYVHPRGSLTLTHTSRPPSPPSPHAAPSAHPLPHPSPRPSATAYHHEVHPLSHPRRRRLRLAQRARNQLQGPPRPHPARRHPRSQRVRNRWDHRGSRKMHPRGW